MGEYHHGQPGERDFARVPTLIRGDAPGDGRARWRHLNWLSERKQVFEETRGKMQRFLCLAGLALTLGMIPACGDDGPTSPSSGAWRCTV